MKFGGSSVADAERIRRCADVVRAQQEQHEVITVVSAMGGITDMLLELADAAGAGNRSVKYTLLAEIRKRHEEAARELGASDKVDALLGNLETLVAGIVAVGELTPRSRDAVVSHGEQLSAMLTAAALDGVAKTGQEVGIVTDENYGEAEPLMNLSLYQIRETLEPLLTKKQRIVVTGFLAATQHGVTSTIGRGGSDYTATLLGAGIKADEIWICSDVDGLMTADPRNVPDAKLLDQITFAESIEMGQFGAKSMHPRALEPAAEHKIPVRVRSSFNTDCPGTLVTDSAPTTETMRSVLLLKNVSLINVAGAAMIGRPGTAAKVFIALAEAEVNVQMISQTVSEAGISLVVADSQLPRARAALEGQLLRTNAAKRIEVNEDVAVVAAVGSGMRGAVGVAARIFNALSAQKINIDAIAQGSSELSVCLVVASEDGPAAVRAIHDEFGLGKS